MGIVRVCNFAVSLDGYGAGPDQGVDAPLGVGGTRLHEWIFRTRRGREMIGELGGAEGVDNDFVVAGFTNIGATVMGRNMFGPVRGPWPDDSWTGWWGDEPPFHHPVFVLTHHPRESFAMEGGTRFHFVTDGLDAALTRARDAAGDADVRLGGGVATIQEALRSRAVDDVHMVVVPVLLGRGERLFDHLDGGPAGYECAAFIPSDSVVHIRLART
jgi:dihydrofolate reductase